MLIGAIPGMHFWWLGRGEKCGKVGLLTVIAKIALRMNGYSFMLSRV